MNKSLLSILIIFLLLFPLSCRLYKLERQLDPENAEFLSKVNYIITKEERKIFLELPDEEKESFREEFWKRRDPDPSTEENEFKIEYFNRIERANELFHGEGRPGWMTDRGRIFVLFGPPSDRMTYPMGTGPYGRCQKEKGIFDFNLEIEISSVHPGGVEGLIVIAIPYAVIWFQSKEDILETTMDLSLDLKDSDNQLLWEYRGSFIVLLDEIELLQKSQQKHIVKIPFSLEKDTEKLKAEKNLFHAHLKNRTGGEEVRKVKEFKVESLS